MLVVWLAGVSAVLDIDIEPFRKWDRARDTLRAEYMLYSARCGACHDLPAPTSMEPWEWSGVLSRMGKHIESAGLMPTSAEERSVLLRYLESHGR